MPRFNPPVRGDMDNDQQALFDKIAGSRDNVGEGPIGGPFDVWLLNAELAKRVVGLGNFFRFRTSVDRRQVELAILHCGQFWQAQFEWYAHEPMALEAGLPQAVIDALHRGEKPAFENASDAAAWQLCEELQKTHRVSEPTFKTAVAAFGEQGVAEITNLIGYYTMVSMSLNAFDVALPDGAKPPFPA